MALERSREPLSDPARPLLRRAAQYVRMSTEHQQYSTENQGDVIARYAELHGLEIVRTYADEGKSGLNLEGRASLQQLIADVTEHRADFEVVLVYDISRWGRFQDADQSAYYEYICRSAGVKVQYCAEQFDNDGSISALFTERGQLSGLIIDETEDMPSSSAYRHRFGSLVRAYELIG